MEPTVYTTVNHYDINYLPTTLDSLSGVSLASFNVLETQVTSNTNAIIELSAGIGGDTAVSTKVRSSSATWDSTYTTVLANSAVWSTDNGDDASVSTKVRASSANWDNTYTTVQANSGTWSTALKADGTTVGATSSIQLFTTGIAGGNGANVDLIIQGTTDATRTTSYVNIQPNGGNVGIGTWTPTATLTVDSGNSNIEGFRFDGNGGSGQALSMFGGGGAATGIGWRSYVLGCNFTLPADNIPQVVGIDSSYTKGYAIGFGVENGTDTGITFWSGNGADADMAERMRITNAGNVGIGTTVPEAKLHIAKDCVLTDSTSTDGQLNITGANIDKRLVIGFDTTGDFGYIHGFHRGVDYKPIVFNAYGGNVGIGTTTPTATLHLKAGTAVASTAPLKFTSGTLMTVPEAGAVEYDGKGFVFTDGSLYGLRVSTYKGANSSGTNIFVGGGGQNSVGAVGETYKGAYNTSFGINSLYSNTTGFYNTCQGYSSLYSNTQGYFNTAQGHVSLTDNTTGYLNTAQGYSSLRYNVTGFENTAQGHGSLLNNETGNNNTAQGSSALQYNVTGSGNTAVGYHALLSNGKETVATALVEGISYTIQTTGDTDFTLIGAADSNPGTVFTKNSTAGLGTGTAASNTSYSTAVGSQALLSNTVGSGNVALGYSSLFGNTTGNFNTALGYQSLFQNSTGSGNNTIGLNALYSNTTGGSNTAIGVSTMYGNTTGSNNLAIGGTALYNNVTGGSNIAVGVGTGYNGSVSLSSMSSTVFIGNGANSSVDGITNSIAIGSTAQVTKSNQVVLGNSSIVETVLRGNVVVNAYERHIQISARVDGTVANQPTPVDFGSVAGLQFPANADKYAFCQFEVPNDWNGTDIVFEIDWFPDSGATSGTDTVEWKVDYRSIAEGESCQQGTLETVTVTDSGDYAQYVTKHARATLTFNNANQPLTKQDHVYIRVYRNTSVANDFAGTVTVAGYEMIYQSVGLPTSN